MIIGVIGLTGFLFDDDPFRITRSTRDLPIDVVFPVTATGKSALPILKLPPSDVTSQRSAAPLLEHCQQIIGLLRRSPCDPASRIG